MIILYTVDEKTKESVLQTIRNVLKKKKFKQEFILFYCCDTRRVLKFSRLGLLYNSYGSIVKGSSGLANSKSLTKKYEAPLTPPFTRRVAPPLEILNPGRHLTDNLVAEPIKSTSSRFLSAIKQTNHEHEYVDDHCGMDDIVDQNNTKLVFYNDDKEVGTLYSCFYLKDQLIAVKPEFYEKVKQESDLNQIVSVAELFGIKEITINKVNIKEKGITAGATVETNGLSQSFSLEKSDYLNENKTLRLSYDLAKSKFIFHTMKEFSSMLSRASPADIEDLPLSYSDLLRNVDLYRLISARLEANMSIYNFDLRSVKKQNYGITLDAAYLTKCGFKIMKHDVQFNHLKVKLHYYNLEELILSSNLILNRKCFEMIAPHSNLLNAYLENFLLLSSPREFFKYKILKQLDPEKHRELLSRVKFYSDLDLTTGSFLEELRGMSHVTQLKCDEESLTKIQELYPYLYNFKKDPRLIDHTHGPCYRIRCSFPFCHTSHLKIIAAWIIRVFNMYNDKLLMVNGNNSKAFFDALYRIIINLRHMPNYEKFVKLILEDLQPFLDDKEPDFGFANIPAPVPPEEPRSRANSFHSLTVDDATQV